MYMINNLEYSPLINTPYLDSSSVDTPFIDGLSADTPPFFDTMGDFNLKTTNGYHALRKEYNDQDICVAGYLYQEPVVKFNGDPSLLIIDKSKSIPPITTENQKKPSPTVKLENLDEQSDFDTLFPPLSQTSDIEMNAANLDDTDLFIKFEVNEQDDQHEQSQNVKEEPKEEEKQEEVVEKSERSRKRRLVVEQEPIKTSRPKLTNTKEPKFHQCPLCDHKSKRRYNLSTHIKTHDKNRIKEFNCDNCTKAFDRRHDRDRHMAAVHRKERVHGCMHCINQFARKDGLNRHLVQKHGYDEAELMD